MNNTAVEMFLLSWSWYYIRGMWRYRTDNATTRSAIVQTVCDETGELLEAIHSGTMWDVIDEGFDVLHSLLLLLAWDISCFIGLSSVYTKMLMVCFPLLAVPTAMKHARRVKSHNCVRNRHHCLAKNHNC